MRSVCRQRGARSPRRCTRNALEPGMSPEQGLAFLFAMVIGLSLGALGSGGSIVTLPVLVYVARVDPKSAVGMSMAIVGATSLVAASQYWRRGSFDKKAALLLGITGMVGA